MAINFQKLETITRALKPFHQTGRAFHTTFVFNKKKLVCIANNDYSKQHRYHKFGHYKSKYQAGSYRAGIHSECSALIKMGIEDCSHLTFVNVRIDNGDRVAVSKPCENCQALLKNIGYKKLWYYNGQRYICK
jgi:deoxycytidylate deaminase